MGTKDKEQWDVFSCKTNVGRLLRVGFGVVVCLMCLLCIVIRAHDSAITLDEAHTYVNYVTEFRFSNIGGFFQNYDGRANNHLLNTALIWIVDRVSGIYYDEFLIRLPNICFGIFYGVLCFYLYEKRKIPTFLFLLLMLNATMNLAFTQARGYGMAAALVMAAVYCLKRYVESDYTEFRLLSLTILFLTLAEAANTVVLLLTASAALLLFYIMLRKKALVPYLKRSWIFLTLAAGLNLLLLAYHLYAVADGEEKALGSYHGNPVSGILGSFASMYTGRLADILTVALVFLIAGAALYGVLKKRTLFFVYLFIIYFFLCSVMAVIVGKGLPSGKQLVPACPMLIFAVGEALELVWGVLERNVLRGGRYSRLLWIAFTAGCSLLLAGHFIKAAHLQINNTLRTRLYDSVMGAYQRENLDSEEMHKLHTPFYQKQFLYRYGYDIYQGKYTIEAMSLGETLRMLQNQKFDALIEVNNREILKQYSYELNRLGIDMKNLPETLDFILIKHGEENVIEYLCECKGADGTQDTVLGEMSLFYGSDGAYGVYMDGSECLVVNPEELRPDISICVWQYGNDEPMDYKLFTVE